MPLTGESFPVASAGDVAALVELLGRAVPDARLRAKLGDHFSYVAGVSPEWFRPHQQTVVAELLDGFDVTYDNLCVLLADAPDGCVEHLARRLRAGWQFQAAWALAAIGTEAALAAVADLVRTGADAREFEDCGIWVPPKGPAQRRFSLDRRAVELRQLFSRASVAAADHPVGLRLADVVRDPGATAVAWHYVSLRTVRPARDAALAG
ncbi:hypothetical protein GCM10009682_63750 [Luedemannella flava]|uniref:Uncharacterized protein n=1 Tax=Luedemannella flava TaxID=349316 RepID=A0ABN2MV08_9ACTN